jgi:hypothetical protein
MTTIGAKEKAITSFWDGMKKQHKELKKKNNKQRDDFGFINNDIEGG